MILGYFLMFACGALAKLADSLADRQDKLQHAAGAFYGTIAGLLAASSAEFATLIAALSVGMLLAGKIDARPHQIAIAIIFAAFAISRPAVSLGLLALFAGLSLLDEALNDLIDRARERGRRISRAAQAIGGRLFLEAGTLAFGLASGNLAYFFAILCFDLAYNLAGRAARHFPKA